MENRINYLTNTAKKIIFFTFFITVCFFVFGQNYNYQYNVIKVDSTFDKNVDLTVETYINTLKMEKDKKMGQVIGTSKEFLTSFEPMSPLSNLLVDMLFEWGNQYLEQNKEAKADFAMLNFGGIRANLPKGKITVGDIYQISPFDNTVAFIKLKGSELKKLFDNFTEKRNAPMANVQTIYTNGRLISYTIGGLIIEDERIYTLITINFLALGGDEFLKGFKFESAQYLPTNLRDVYLQEIRKKTAQGIEIESSIDDRVIIKPTP